MTRPGGEITARQRGDTAPAPLRLHDADLSQWRKRSAQKWERAFVFFKHEGEAPKGRNWDAFQQIVDPRGNVIKKAG